MFKTRLLSGIVLVILMVGILYMGGLVTGGATLLLSLGGMYELLRIYELEKTPLGLAGYAATVVYYALLFVGKTEYILPLIMVFVLFVLAIYVIRYPVYSDRSAMSVVFAFLYVTVMLSYFYQIRELKDGGFLIVLVFICSWVNDTCAYCVGVTMGKHKMTPKLSPKKSIEGLVGGIAGSAIVGAVYGYVAFKVDYAPLVFALIGAVGAVVAVIGDLTASAIKRNNDIKDYGKLIPGHGGILDRFDSIIFTAPIIYYILIYTIA